MAKKILLDVKDEPSLYTLIGISCHLKDYRLSFLLNQALEFSFIKYEDLTLMLPGKQESAGFSFYHYYDEDRFNTYCMVANRSQEYSMIPEMKQTDYLLFIEGEFRKPQKDELFNKIRQIPNILTVFEIRLSDVKNHAILLNEIELHLMQLFKKTKGRYQPK